MFETILCSAAIALSSLTGTTHPLGVPAAAMVKDEKHPVIVHIVGRDKTITVKASRSGKLYSLTSTDGKVLIADATEAKFAQLEPELYQQVRQGLAIGPTGAIPIADDRIGE